MIALETEPVAAATPAAAAAAAAEPASAPSRDAASHLLARAQALAAAGRGAAARPLLAAARRLGTPDLDTLDRLEAQVLLHAGQPQDARALLDEALRRGPSARLFLLRAEARLQADDPTGAMADAAEAVIATPDDAAAKAALGVALAECGRWDEAIACLAEAARSAPAHPGFCLALARAHEMAGDPRRAAAVLATGIVLAPTSLALRNEAARLAIAGGAFAKAIALAEAARREGLIDACLLGMHGHALSSLGRHAEAADVYAEALKLAPEDVYVRHMVAASGRLPAAARAPEAYVRAVFDGYADRFESHLTALDYRVPGLLRAAVMRHVALPEVGRLGPVLDLGCGTGLAAAATADLRLGPWHGVDLSTAMLRRAAAKGLYADLQAASIEAVLAAPGPVWRVALAADVLCYFGALEPFLTALRPRLAAAGWLFASFEIASDADGWRLGAQGRYRHAPDYVLRCAEAAGFAVREAAEAVLRREEGAPVLGMILAAQADGQ